MRQGSISRTGLALALTLVLGTAGGLWLGRRFLAQIDRLGRTAERIGEGWLSERISRTGSETRRGTSRDSWTAVTSSPSKRVRSRERT